MGRETERFEPRPLSTLPIIDPLQNGRWRPTERYENDSLQNSEHPNGRKSDKDGTNMDVDGVQEDTDSTSPRLVTRQTQGSETVSSFAPWFMGSSAKGTRHRGMNTIDPTLEVQEESDTESVEPLGRPRKIRRRLPAKEGRFRCDFPDCGKVFDRHSDLTKHQKYHLPENERPFKCPVCGRGFLFPKDLKRHESLHQNDDASRSRASPPAAAPPQLLVRGLADARTHKYQPLLVDCEFRILTILPGVDGEIHCSLTHYDLSFVSTIPPYEALSWSWDYSKDHFKILLRSQDDFRMHSVPPSLHGALKWLRYEDHPRRIWVDFLCINNKDEQERTTQVPLINSIFSNAENVRVWLGPRGNDSDLALRLVKDVVCNIGSLEGTTPIEGDLKAWKSLSSLMNRPWFNRRWVVPEIAFSKRITMHCGDSSVDWNEFETAVALFENFATDIKRLYKTSNSAVYDPSFFGDVAAMGAVRLVRAISDIFRRDETGDIVERRYTLSDLVCNLSFLENTVPHDVIYSMLPLAKDVQVPVVYGLDDKWSARLTANRVNGAPAAAPESGSALVTMEGRPPNLPEGCLMSDPMFERGGSNMPTDLRRLTQSQERLARTVIEKFRRSVKESNIDAFPIDYQSTFFELCKQFLAFVATRPGFPNLDILCRPWAPGDGRNNPSYVPSLANAAFDRLPASNSPGGFQTKRQNADSLVGQTTYGTPCYNASNSRTAQKGDWRFGDTERGENEYSLFLVGFVLDTINEIEDSSQVGNVPIEWLRLVGWDPRKDKGRERVAGRPPEMLWRTLVADRGPNGTFPPMYYQSALEYAVRKSTPTVGVETTALKSEGDPIMAEFLKRIEAVIWNRRLFRSSRDMLLGVAPKQAKEGDRESCTCTSNGPLS